MLVQLLSYHEQPTDTKVAFARATHFSFCKDPTRLYGRFLPLVSALPVLMPAKLDIFNDELIYADVWMNFASLACADVPKMTSRKVVI